MKSNSPGKPYTLVGAGPLTATVWKTASESGGYRYRFNIIRTNPATGTVSQRFRPQDVRHLAKLLQVLAFTLSDDGCLDDVVRRDLQSLSATLRRANQKPSTPSHPGGRSCSK